ncbi:MAG: energy coupling factor transporter S component ThiW, partial [Monoglobaceae bacterium]
IIGAIVSYPVMTFIWGKEGLSWLFYVPSFICGTLIGGSIAYAFLKKLSQNGVLQNFQKKLETQVYADKSSLLGNSVSIAAIGVIGYVVINLASGIFKFESGVWSTVAKVVLIAFIGVGVVYYLIKTIKREGSTVDKQAN